MLGCNQPKAESQFKDLLTQTADRDNPPSGALGMMFSGDFGAGKSHLLTHLEHQALSQGFVCSKVAISKELLSMTWARCSSQRWTTVGCQIATVD